MLHINSLVLNNLLVTLKDKSCIDFSLDEEEECNVFPRHTHTGCEEEQRVTRGDRSHDDDDYDDDDDDDDCEEE